MAISAATTSSDLSDITSTNDESVYRFCLVAMGWNGANTMIDLDFVALDTQKRVEELGNMLEDSSASATSANGVDFDVKIEIVPTASSTADADAETSAITSIGAHKAILWARSDFFKSLLTEELVSDSTSSSTTTIRMEGSVEHVKALLKFLYTDHGLIVFQVMCGPRHAVSIALARSHYARKIPPEFGASADGRAWSLV